MKKILLILGLLIPVLNVAQDLSTYQSRKSFILGAFKDVVLEEGGKHGLPKAIARLHANPNDQPALTYISTILDRKTQNMFDFPGVALALCMYWDSFSPEQIAELKSDLERLAKSDKIGGEGFLGHGTENHATMMWCSAYLFGQLFPDARWTNGMTSSELMADMKERLRKTFKNRYEKGYTEYLSTTYEVVMNFLFEIFIELDIPYDQW
jgi:ABC-type transporter MlaC component